MVRGNPLVRNKRCLAHAVTEDAQIAPHLQSMGRAGNNCKSKDNEVKTVMETSSRGTGYRRMADKSGNNMKNTARRVRCRVR